MRSSLSGTKRADGRWQIVVTLTTVSGAKVRKAVYGATQAEVQRKAQELLFRESRTSHEAHTIADLIEVYGKDVLPTKSAGTKRQHSPAYIRLEAFFADKDLRSIRRSDVARFMRYVVDQASGDGFRAAQAYRNVLSSLMNYGLELGWIDENVAKGTPLPSGIVPKPKTKPRLTPDEYRRILEAEEDPVLRSLWATLGETGYRPTEALAMTRESLFRAIDCWWLRGGGKTEAGRNREVPLPDRLGHELAERTGPLFQHPDYGRALNYDEARTRWEAAVRKAGIEPRNMYQLRKLAISRWIAAGIGDDVVKTLAGHSSIRLTKDVYNRLSRERLMLHSKEGRYVGGMSEIVSNELSEGGGMDPF